MDLARHLLKRTLLILAGYFVSVLIGLVAIVAIYAVLASMPDAPDYFHALAVSPIVLLFVPPLGIFVHMLALVLTGVQSLVLALFSEIFELRHPLIHVLFGTAVSASGFVFASPTLIDGDIRQTDWADIGIVAASGMVAGFVYWLIAGRDAGFRRIQAEGQPLPSV